MKASIWRKYGARSDCLVYYFLRTIGGRHDLRKHVGIVLAYEPSHFALVAIEPRPNPWTRKHPFEWLVKIFFGQLKTTENVAENYVGQRDDMLMNPLHLR